MAFKKESHQKLSFLNHRLKAKSVVSSGLTVARDRTKTTDKNATYVIPEALRSVGCNSSEVVLSREAVRRKQMKFRESFAENLKESFKAYVPLTILWDGKMMSDICERDIVDRLLMDITKYGINQLHVFLILHLELVKIWLQR